ncbi:pentapeptide repeat-containing protein [Nostoc sp.]|uniref:pentapeptide repeat-containing protein n=1 Tax=Nostoc sp. TaxID=1180 RepID=UPI003FA5895D
MGSDLSGANLGRSNLESVAMQGTNLKNATLLGAITIETEFAGAFFHNTTTEEGDIVDGLEYFD